jgi:hypothetical protein
VEIIQELEPDDPSLEIPWASPHNARLRFIDLEKFPKKLEHLEECRKYPPLASLLRQVNTAGSALRTAKCDVWSTTKLAEDERLDFDMRYKIGSYVDLVFDCHRLNAHLESQLRLGKKLEKLLSRCRIQAQIEIAVRRCLFHPKERWGYYLTIFVHAYGATRTQAKNEWSRAVDSLGDALSKIGPSFRQKSPKELKP